MAGAAGFLLPQGLVQMEGIVSPPPLLGMIRSEAPLADAFQRFGIDYYVTTGVRDEDGCTSAEEPTTRVAGLHSRQMRGRLCDSPLATFDDSRVPVYIFDVNPGR
ncbi:MAG: hypothetical protein ABI634_20105 [Acidobacteriota bacterium]